jgi:hypothetical protein
LTAPTCFIDDQSTMFVYGIRCSPSDLLGLPSGAIADYYMDYSLLVFPCYTRPGVLQSYGYLTPDFWKRAGKMIGGNVHVVEREHPWISPEEDAVVRVLREQYPAIQTEWYYVPRSHIGGETDPSEEDEE